MCWLYPSPVRVVPPCLCFGILPPDVRNLWFILNWATATHKHFCQETTFGSWSLQGRTTLPGSTKSAKRSIKRTRSRFPVFIDNASNTLGRAGRWVTLDGLETPTGFYSSCVERVLDRSEDPFYDTRLTTSLVLAFNELSPQQERKVMEIPGATGDSIVRDSRRSSHTEFLCDGCGEGTIPA